MFFVFASVHHICMPRAEALLSAQVIATEAEIRNEFGGSLPTADARFAKDSPAATGALVQVIATGADLAAPPTTDGTPDPENTVVYETRVGMGVYPNGNHTGMFSLSLTPRPAHGTKLFVRIFNAPTLESSSFYTDSGIYTVTAVSNSVFWLAGGATSLPLDAADDDGDGLNNSYEKSLSSDPLDVDTDKDGIHDLEEVEAGTSPTSSDTDGDGISDPDELSLGTNPTRKDSDDDGMSDPDELLVGTDPTDVYSYLALYGCPSEGGNAFHFSWPSVTGLTYRIESIVSGGPEQEFMTQDLMGTGADMAIELQDLPSGIEHRWFRLKVYRP